MIRARGGPSSGVRLLLAIISVTGCVSVAFASWTGLRVVGSSTNERPSVPRDPGRPESQSSTGCLLLGLALSGSGNETLLTWYEEPGAQAYCVERGNLGILRATGGNFTQSLEQELASGTTATSLLFSGTPGEGEAYWFLVKDSPDGTFDSGCPSQVGSRDHEILSAGDFCVN